MTLNDIDAPGDDRHGIALWIDAAPTHPAAAMWHFQKDPFPGGSTFRLVIRGAELQERFAFIRNGNVASANDVFSLFGARMYAILGPARRTANPVVVRWVLNRFERIHVETDAITLEGICSPIIHP